MHLFFLLLCSIFVSNVMVQETNDILMLQQRINSLTSGSSGTFAVAFIDLQSGKSMFINENKHFHAASTMKTPVMIEIFNQIDRKLLTLDSLIPVTNTFKSIVDGTPYSLEISSDSEDILYNRIGEKESIARLMEVMITVSSNLATNILIDLVKPSNVMKTMKSMGLNDIQVLRGVEDGKAFNAGKNNTVTAGDLAKLFVLIANGESISKSASSSMVEILRKQRFKDMIPAYLPKGVVVAHKTGSITNVQHDSGIIYLPDGRIYVLVILSKDLKNNKEGISVISKISKEIYDYMTER